MLRPPHHCASLSGQHTRGVLNFKKVPVATAADSSFPWQCFPDPHHYVWKPLERFSSGLAQGGAHRLRRYCRTRETLFLQATKGLTTAAPASEHWSIFLHGAKNHLSHDREVSKHVPDLMMPSIFRYQQRCQFMPTVVLIQVLAPTLTWKSLRAGAGKREIEGSHSLSAQG